MSFIWKNEVSNKGAGILSMLQVTIELLSLNHLPDKNKYKFCITMFLIHSWSKHRLTGMKTTVLYGQNPGPNISVVKWS